MSSEHTSDLQPIGSETCPAGCGIRMQVYQKAGRKYFVIDPGLETCGLLEGPKPKGCSAVSALCAAMLEGSLMVGPFLPDDPAA